VAAPFTRQAIAEFAGAPRSGWATDLIGAEKDPGGYAVAWKNSGTNQYTI
jgi:hypothetical protein